GRDGPPGRPMARGLGAPGGRALVRTDLPEMKITIVTGAFLPVPPIMGGAIEKAWYALAREFARRGHEVVFVSRKLPQLPAEEAADGVRHVRVRGFDTPRSLPWLKLLDLF